MTEDEELLKHLEFMAIDDEYPSVQKAFLMAIAEIKRLQAEVNDLKATNQALTSRIESLMMYTEKWRP